MNSKNILEVIEEISDISSKNEKALVLKEQVLKPNIAWFLKQVLDPRINYGLTSKNITHDELEADKLTLEDALEQIKETRTHFNKQSIINQLSKDDFEVLKMIIDKKINYKGKKFGMSAKSINKVYGYDLIYNPKYMRCSTLNEDSIKNIEFPAIAEVKYDSEFVNIFWLDDEVRCESRNGLISDIERIQNELSKIPTDNNLVIMGELLLEDETKSREENRSAISSYTSRKSTLESLNKKLDNAKTDKASEKVSNDIQEHLDRWSETAQNLTVRVWDVVSYSEYLEGLCDKPRMERLNNVHELISNFKLESIKMTEYKILDSLEDTNDYFNDLIEQGEEGLVLKDLSSVWKDGTSKQQIKFKESSECELIVRGWNEGEGENVGGIGSFICESSCGIVKVNVAGMTKEMRGMERTCMNESSKGWKPIEDFDKDSLNDKIITVRFNRLSQNQDGGFSLSFPRIVSVRRDKDIADDFEYISTLVGFKG